MCGHYQQKIRWLELATYGSGQPYSRALRRRAEATHDKQAVLERRLVTVRAGISHALRTLGGTLAPAARPEEPASVNAALMQVRLRLRAPTPACIQCVHRTRVARLLLRVVAPVALCLLLWLWA